MGIIYIVTLGLKTIQAFSYHCFYWLNAQKRIYKILQIALLVIRAYSHNFVVVNFEKDTKFFSCKDFTHGELPL